MSNFSWKVVVSILGLRLIPMKLMPQMYDRNARIKHRLFLMFAFYSVWLFIQLTLLVVWFTPLNLLTSQLVFRLLVHICVVSSALALIFAFLDCNAIADSENLVDKSDENYLESIKNIPISTNTRRVNSTTVEKTDDDK